MMVSSLIPFLAQLNPYLVVVVLGLAYLYRACTRWRWPLIIDPLLLALYAWRPSLGMLAFVLALYAVRHVPALAREVVIIFKLDAFDGWTARVILFVMPGLEAFSTTPAMPPLPAAPVSGATTVLPVRPPSGPARTAQTAALTLPLPMADWWPGVQDHPDTTPHTFVLGPSGKGKSVLIEALARTRSGQVLVIQPNKKEHEWQAISVVQCADDGSYLPIGRALEAVRAEFTRHGGAMKTGDPGPWLTVAWDELPLCVGKLGDLARQLIIDLLSAGRPRKLRLLGGATSDGVRALGIEGYGDLLQSCAVIRLGTFARARLPELEGSAWPASLEIDGRLLAVDRGAAPQLLRTPLPVSRVWDLAAVCLTGPGTLMPAQTAGPSVSDRQTDDARHARIERLAGMRAMGYSRDRARVRLQAEGATLDNNEWAEAGKLLKAPTATPSEPSAA